MRVFGKKILLGGEPMADPILQAEWVADAEASMRFPGYLDGLASTLRYYPLNGLEKDYERVGAIGLPVILIWGDRDTTKPYLNAERAAQLTKGRLVTVKGASHTVNTEQPTEVNSPLASFSPARLNAQHGETRLEFSRSAVKANPLP